MSRRDEVSAFEAGIRRGSMFVIFAFFVAAAFEGLRENPKQIPLVLLVASMILLGIVDPENWTTG